jgi:hypothetical protein
MTLSPKTGRRPARGKLEAYREDARINKKRRLPPMWGQEIAATFHRAYSIAYSRMLGTSKLLDRQ